MASFASSAPAVLAGRLLIACPRLMAVGASRGGLTTRLLIACPRLMAVGASRWRSVPTAPWSIAGLGQIMRMPPGPIRSSGCPRPGADRRVSPVLEASAAPSPEVSDPGSMRRPTHGHRGREGSGRRYRPACPVSVHASGARCWPDRRRIGPRDRAGSDPASRRARRSPFRIARGRCARPGRSSAPSVATAAPASAVGQAPGEQWWTSRTATDRPAWPPEPGPPSQSRPNLGEAADLHHPSAHDDGRRFTVHHLAIGCRLLTEALGALIEALGGSR